MKSFISKYSIVERLALAFDSVLGSRLFSTCKIWEEKLICNKRKMSDLILIFGGIEKAIIHKLVLR
jgi:hypothetical protein